MRNIFEGGFTPSVHLHEHRDGPNISRHMDTYNSFSTTQLIIAGSLDSPHLNLGATVATFVMLVIARTAKARCALWPARWTCVALLPEDLEMQLVVRRMLESRGNAFLERTH